MKDKIEIDDSTKMILQSAYDEMNRLQNMVNYYKTDGQNRYNRHVTISNVANVIAAVVNIGILVCVLLILKELIK